MRLNVNPTRMELTSLKRRLVTAKRGHKLLKDKQDELMRRFVELAKENYSLRKQVEEELQDIFNNFLLVRAEALPQFIEEAVSSVKSSIEVEINRKNIMSVIVPQMTFKNIEQLTSNNESYGYANTTAELDLSINSLRELLPMLLKLAEVEKTCQLMAEEIEKTRRRVNALEYRTIPDIEETIKYIKMKLDENERGSLIRLMKVKTLLQGESST